MTTFNELTFNRSGGRQAVVKFDNGYSASIINDGYGSERGLYELAVKHGGSIVYDTPVTDDVVGYLTEDDVTDHLAQIAALPEREGAA